MPQKGSRLQARDLRSGVDFTIDKNKKNLRKSRPVGVHGFETRPLHSFFPDYKGDLVIRPTDGILAKARSALVVCLGNTCRSPAAEGFLRKFTRHLGFRIESAGLNNYFSSAQPQSIKFVKELEAEDISNHKARRVTSQMVETFDLIIVMERYMKDTLIEEFPQLVDLPCKIFTLKESCAGLELSRDVDIEDPYMHSDQKYREIITEIRDCTRQFAGHWETAARGYASFHPSSRPYENL